MTLREIVKALRETYCGSIGAEYMYVSDPAQKRWVQQRLESIRSTPSFSAEQKIEILGRLTAAEGLERYLHTKYVGQKRFSLEGSESFIASMDELVQRAGASGVQEIVIGMAHRGRLNVLVNILGKMPADLFAEFEGKVASELPGGDVKYHNGFSSDISTPGGRFICRSLLIHRISRSSIRWSKVRCAHGRNVVATLRATRCCRCSFMETRRLRARVS